MASVNSLFKVLSKTFSSAAKARGIPRARLNPMSLRRSLENTAVALGTVEPLGQGHGLIDVKGAWKSIEAANPSDTSGEAYDPWFDVSFQVRVDSLRFSRGIYLRQAVEANTATTFKVEVTPVFFDKETISPERLVQFEMRLRLESSVDWVKCPATLQMHQAGKTISLAIDPRQLPVGTLVSVTQTCHNLTQNCHNLTRSCNPRASCTASMRPFQPKELSSRFRLM